MTLSLNKLWIVGASALALVITSGSAEAVSIGAPKGRPYYGAPRESRGPSFRSWAPSVSTETRQSFSHEPTEKAAPPKATRKACPPAASTAPKAERHDVTEAPQTVRRSFSYEPSSRGQATARRGAQSGGKPPWAYQKTDPRRYGR